MNTKICGICGSLNDKNLCDKCNKRMELGRIKIKDVLKRKGGCN
jgi:recombinational DNA repair protein RecR